VPCGSRGNASQTYRDDSVSHIYWTTDYSGNFLVIFFIPSKKTAIVFLKCFKLLFSVFQSDWFILDAVMVFDYTAPSDRIDWWIISWQVSERRRFWPNRGTISAFAWRDWGHTKNLVRIVGVPTEDRTEDLVNTCLVIYRHTSLLEV
jgi:hypothetical protein